MKKVYIIATFLLIALSVIEISYLTHADALASESMNAQKLRNEIAKVEEKNQILKSEILSHSSILIVSSRAAELGFSKPKDFISLKKLDSIALNHE